MGFILNKLREPSTYAGLFLLLAGFGVNIAPELSDAIMQLCISVAGFVFVLMNEKK